MYLILCYKGTDNIEHMINAWKASTMDQVYLTWVLMIKGGLIYIFAQYCEKHYLNIFAEYMDNYHKSDTNNRNMSYF